jgi:3-hydroxybutyryl-CoA dehydrogenase
VENAEVKKGLFDDLERIVSKECILATNTSSLSVASVSSACNYPERFIGIHFFNPATLMPLVEIIPGISTSPEILKNSRALIDSWGKITVLAKDTPGFIVNRIARPFYGESIRMYEEGLADFATIDWAVKEYGGFRMGPFELMDFIGNDINYAVTETIFREFWFDPRYKPSFTQKRLVEARRFGRKSGRGYYTYGEGVTMPEPAKDERLGKDICWRVLVMLINEAAEALYLKIASREDIDLAMTKGVNYPKGLLKWADELGVPAILETIDRLYEEYHEDRYRASALLRRMVAEEKTFY